MRVLLAGLLAVLAPCLDAAERVQDFAYACTLASDAAGPLRRVELPAWVHMGVTRADLGDVRVFNADGEVVPHAFMPRPTPATGTEPGLPLTYFAIRAPAGAAPEAIDIEVRRTAAGTITHVQARRGSSAAVMALTGYLIDASSFKAPIASLELAFREPTSGFTGTVRVEGSDDLARWSTLAAGAPVVALQFGGERLERRVVELAATHSKYLRLTWPAGQPALELTGLLARPAGVTVEPARTWRTVAGRPVAGRDGEFEFDLAGRFPVDRLRIALPQDNTVVSVQLLSRSDPQADWRPAASGVLYRLRQEREPIESPALAIGVSHDRYWLLRVDQKGGGIGRGVVQLEAGWLPQALVFAARGKGPFQLTYGNARAQPTAYPIESLVPGFRTDAEPPVDLATAGEQRTVAGAAALRRQHDYRSWSLWAVLFLGVALLGWMAWRLGRQIGAAPGKTPAERTDA
jgi:hypothetical protein